MCLVAKGFFLYTCINRYFNDLKKDKQHSCVNNLSVFFVTVDIYNLIALRE